MNKISFIKVGKSLLLLLVLLFIADRSIGFFLDRIYFKQKKGQYFQTTYAIKNAREDVLIFGSSRATHHYVSEKFEEKFNLSTYNLGRDGRNILYSYAIFSNMIASHKPKMVILDVQSGEFTWKAGKEGEDAMVSALLPYIDSPRINESVSKISKSDIILSKIFKTYPYNSNVAQILGYYYGFLSDTETEKGYVPLKGNKVSPSAVKNTKKKSPPACDSTLVNTFKSFLALAKAHQIDVYVVVSPTTSLSNDNSIAIIKKVTKEAGVTFLDFSNSFDNYKLFYDPTHLNVDGANKFTDLIIEELKSRIVDGEILLSNSKF